MQAIQFICDECTNRRTYGFPPFTSCDKDKIDDIIKECYVVRIYCNCVRCEKYITSSYQNRYIFTRQYGCSIRSVYINIVNDDYASRYSMFFCGFNNRMEKYQSTWKDGERINLEEFYNLVMQGSIILSTLLYFYSVNNIETELRKKNYILKKLTEHYVHGERYEVYIVEQAYLKTKRAIMGK